MCVCVCLQGYRKELPEYQKCLMEATVDAQSFIVEDRDEQDGGKTTASLNLLAKRLEDLNEKMDRVARMVSFNLENE